MAHIARRYVNIKRSNEFKVFGAGSTGNKQIGIRCSLHLLPESGEEGSLTISFSKEEAERIIAQWTQSIANIEVQLSKS